MFTTKDIPHAGKTCCVTQHIFEPGETFYSILVEDKGRYVRRDYCREAWRKITPPNESVGWWTCRMALASDKKIKLAPNDILLNFFDELMDQPGKEDMRYVLTLLLIRRRIFRYEKEEMDAAGVMQLLVYSARRESTYAIPVIAMDEDKINEVQEDLASLLYSIG